MHLAEDLLLLLTDDDTGKLTASGAEVDVALGGALLVELALAERVGVAGPGERVRARGGWCSRTRPPPATSSSTTRWRSCGTGRASGRRTSWRAWGRGRGPGSTGASSSAVSSAPRATACSASSRRTGGRRGTRPMRRRCGRSWSRRCARVRPPRRGPGRSSRCCSRWTRCARPVDPGSVGLTRKELDANARRIAEGDWAGRAVGHAIDAMNAAVIAAVSTSVVAGGTFRPRRRELPRLARPGPRVFNRAWPCA